MAEIARRQEGAPGQSAALRFAAVEGRAVLRLKSWLPEHMTGGQPVSLAGRTLPARVGDTVDDPARILCFAPGEWVIFSHGVEHAALRDKLQPDLDRQGLALVDLSEGLVTVTVEGGVARDLLSKGCGLDLHPRSFPVGRCARTRFAQVPVVVECRDDAGFELHVARSYLSYLLSWLADAAAEYAAAGP